MRLSITGEHGRHEMENLAIDPGRSAGPVKPGVIEELGRFVVESVCTVGDMALFTGQMLLWLFTRLPRRGVLLPCLYQIGVQSLPVVMLTGAFIGMVIAVQTYDQFRMMHMETNLGAAINMSLFKELGPVLAATMLAGRVGSAMAAELGTMRITEQIDALRALGANPIQYLVVPRFLACLLLIPLLTLLADVAGVFGGWYFATRVLGINAEHYWNHSRNFVAMYDILGGTSKCFFFGAVIAIIACHRGFQCGAGAQGVGRAATEAFVFSFVAILALDFFLGILLNELYRLPWSVGL